jgi:DNA polymerase-3 subunit epsilon
VLAFPLPSEAGLPFGHLLASARKALLRIWAESDPFDMKDALKARGYRWNDGTNGRPKSWWVEVAEEAGEAELTFLRREVYRREVEPSPRRSLPSRGSDQNAERNLRDLYTAALNQGFSVLKS